MMSKAKYAEYDAQTGKILFLREEAMELNVNDALEMAAELNQAATTALTRQRSTSILHHSFTLRLGDTVLTKYYGWGYVIRFNCPSEEAIRERNQGAHVSEQYRVYPNDDSVTEFLIRTDADTTHWCSFREIVDHRKTSVYW